VKLLERAWASTPAGTLPTSFSALANITGLSEAEVGDHHEALFHGWVLVDGRLRFEPMSSLCERIAVRYADAFQAIADQAAAVVQSPEDFVLTPTEVGSPVKGKHRIPKGWKLTDTLRLWLVGNGFASTDDHEFIVNKFTSHYRSKGDMMLDWDQAFQNFALKENRLNLPSGASRLPAFSAESRSARFGAGGQQARKHNADVFERARAPIEGGARG